MISIARFRKELAFKPEDEQKMLHLRLAVIGLWNTLTGGDWSAVERVETFRITDPCCETKLFLPVYPVDEEATFTIEEKPAPQKCATVYSPGEWTATDSANYLLQAKIGIVERVSGQWAGLVRVTYTAGFTADEVDESVINAMILQARFMQARFSDDKIALSTQGFAGGSTNFLTADLHPHFKSTAENWKRRA